MPATLQRKARKRPGQTSTTTPEGIVANDPSAEGFAGELTKFVARGMKAQAALAGNGHAKNGKHKRDDEIRETAFRAAAATEQEVEVAVELVHEHPDNRDSRDDDPDVVSLAESIKQDGQLQSITVRVPPDHWQFTPGHLQIVFGERRWRACRVAGRGSVRCKIRTDLDDATTRRLIAVENAQRKDLDPIEKAKLIVRLCSETQDGSRPMTRKEAAEVVGLETGSAATNLVKLLDLPEAWQRRVASGELAPSWAAEIVRVAQAPPVLDALDNDWLARGTIRDQQTFDSREQVRDSIQWLIRDKLRQVDDEKRLAKLPADKREDLGLVKLEVPDGRGKSKEVQFATNTRAWDELLSSHKAKQTVANAAAAAGHDEGADQDGPPKAAADDREPTAAERRAADEEKREQLAARVAAWRHDWLKELVAARVEDQDWVATRLLCWVQLALVDWKARLPEKMEQAIAACGGKALGLGRKLETVESVRCFGFSRGTIRQNVPYQRCYQLDDVVKEYLRRVVLHEDRDARDPLIPHEVLDALARDYQLDLAEEWKRLQARRGPGDPAAQARFESFFELHQTLQLDELGTALGVIVNHVGSKAAKIKLLITRDRPLPLPKSVAPLPKPKSAKEPAAREKPPKKAARSGRAAKATKKKGGKS